MALDTGLRGAYPCGGVGVGEPRVPGRSSQRGSEGLFLPCIPYNPTGILSAALPQGPGVAPEYHQTGEGPLPEALNPLNRQTSRGHQKEAEPLTSWHLCPPQAGRSGWNRTRGPLAGVRVQAGKFLVLPAGTEMTWARAPGRHSALADPRSHPPPPTTPLPFWLFLSWGQRLADAQGSGAGGGGPGREGQGPPHTPGGAGQPPGRPRASPSPGVQQQACCLSSPRRKREKKHGREETEAGRPKKLGPGGGARASAAPRPGLWGLALPLPHPRPTSCRPQALPGKH